MGGRWRKEALNEVKVRRFEVKKFLCVLVVVALLTAPFGAMAESNWWEGIGQMVGTRTPESTEEPEPTIEPGGEDNPGMLDGDLVPEDDHEHADDVDVGFWDNVLFGPNVVDITSAPYGGAVQYMSIEGWEVAYGSCDDHYCIFGWSKNNSEYHILAETIISEFVPTKSGFAYYGEVKSGKFGWLFRDPDEERPVDLGLSDQNSIFWSDEDYFYYYEYGSGSTMTYYRMDHDGKNKKKLGKLNGRAIAIMPEDGSVAVFNSSKNRVQLWKDGEHKTVYDPTDEILNVIATGHGILWIDHRDYFGRLDQGTSRVDFRFNGTLRSYMTTANQLFAIVDDGAMKLHVRMLNDAYQAHTVVGQVNAQQGLTIEATPGYLNRIVVWGPRESLEFYTPFADSFLPYGYYDMESAKTAGFEGWVGYDGDPGDIPASVERHDGEPVGDGGDG